jgi:hypothetical protein
MATSEPQPSQPNRHLFLVLLEGGNELPPDDWFRHTNYAQRWTQLPVGTQFRVDAEPIPRPGVTFDTLSQPVEDLCYSVHTTEDPLQSFLIPYTWVNHPEHFGLSAQSPR